MNNRSPHYGNDDNIFVFELNTRVIFKKLVNKLFQAEIDAEELRQRLSRRYLFDIHEAFAALDGESNGFITMDDFKKMLHDYGIFERNQDLQNLVKRYNKNQTGKISYSEFFNEIAPKSPSKYQVY